MALPRMRLVCSSFALVFGLLSASGVAQQEKHGRGYKPPPPTAEVTVMVEKKFNHKPMPNASVIFRAMRDDKIMANLETKTDPDGKASLQDLLEVGSHVTVQVIANGFATYATDFELTPEGKQLVVKLERPRAQVSTYSEDTDAPAAVQPGIQEHRKAAPAAVPPPAASPTAPLQTTPPAATPANTPATAPTPNSTGTPQ